MKSFLLIFFVLIEISLKAQEMDSIKECQLDSIDGQEIYLVVETQPQYEGGLRQFFQDVGANFKMADKRDMIGCVRVIFTFVIDANGKIRNFCASANLEFTDELIEVIDKWTPGSIGEKKVPVRMILPMYIKFG